MPYETAKTRAEPYTKIVEELPQMRPETVEFVREGRGGEPASLCVGQQSFGGERAPDHSGPLRSTQGCATMIESSFCFLSGVGRRTERQWWQFRPRGCLNMFSLVTAPNISYGG
jgi:hypothetical protein